jgi:hypothetical protein
LDYITPAFGGKKAAKLEPLENEGKRIHNMETN